MGSPERSQREELWPLGRVPPDRGKHLTHGEQVQRKTGECTLALTLLLPSHLLPMLPIRQTQLEDRQLGDAMCHGQPQREDTEQKEDERRVDLERNMENIQHCIQMEMLRESFWLGKSGSQGKVRIRDRNSGALQ